MKKEKALRAMEHLDDDLILSAMKDSDLNGETSIVKLGRRKNMSRTTMRFKKSPAIAAILAILIGVGIFAGTLISGRGRATIALDVNPSIEIEINRNEEIREVKALNAEAVTVIGDMKLEGVDLNVAVNAIIGAMVTNGYLSTEQNSILVSVNTGNSATSNELKNKISADISTLLGGSNIEASVITQDFETNNSIERMAADNNISEAKAALITKIVAAGLADANGTPYNYARLVGLNVNELKLIIESKNVTVQGITTIGVASGGLYIGRENALQTALTHAGFEKSAVAYSEVEMDYEEIHGAMVYEVEFVVGELKYEYILRAKTGEILLHEAEPKNEIDDDIKGDIPDNIISAEEALAIAYAKAGVSADKAKNVQIELDREAGRYIYEIEFETGIFNRDREYNIDAITGEILRND